MKVWILGAKGQLGGALAATAPTNASIVMMDVDELDITDSAAVRHTMGKDCPDVVFNAAAYTAVDQAESEREAAFAINGDAVGHLAQAAAENSCRLFHVSTDFVFDGDASRPYHPEAKTAPLGVYGASKLKGEQLALAHGATIVRTGWLYAERGGNFVRTMLRLMAEKPKLGIIADQIGTPTFADTLARALWDLTGLTELDSIYHCSDAGVASWYDFAVAIQEEAVAQGMLDAAIPIKPLRTEDYPTPAMRPAYSVLDKSSLWDAVGWMAPHWRTNLRVMLSRVKEAENG